MKSKFYLLLAIAGCLAAVRPALSQAPANAPATPAQSKPSDAQSQAPAKPSSNANQFPDDTNSVPVLPSAATPGAPDSDASGSGSVRLPSDDTDPVRSPEDPAADSSSSSGESSSSTGLDRLIPPSDDEEHAKRGKNGKPIEPEHQETVAEDLNVGTYYLSTKNWKAAQSRFESAMILDPENPDVYFGLAEAQRHLGNFAAAKANYLKLLDYDPDGKHGKEARKILKDPELANAPTASATHPAPARP
jgi:tetratricopeptide (TPR) repeat protein